MSNCNINCETQSRLEEQWKPIPDFPDYEVSNTGLVRSHKRLNGPHILKPGTHTSGYRTVLLRRNGKTHSFPIGRLVLLAFRGPCPEDQEMCHSDGDPTNDHLDNLRWDTHAANMQDAIKCGAWSQSEEEQMKIMNRTFIEAIKREQHRRGETQGVFAHYLGVSRSMLSNFYRRGARDSVVIKILRKYPHFAIYLASEEQP